MENYLAKICFLVVFSWTGLVSAAVITFPSLIREMASYDSVAGWPEPEFTCRQASSYDRATVAPDKPGWFANRDQGNYLSVSNFGDHTESVMMDAEGPGVIVRFWITTDKPDSRIRIFLDGADEPGAPWVLRHPGKKVGSTMYLPIPYARHCKVVLWTGTANRKGRAGARYYQINYRTYAAGAQVETFSKAVLAATREDVARVGRLLMNPPPVVQGRVLSLEKSIPGGQEAALELPAGPSAVRQLEFWLKPSGLADLERALRSTVIRMQTDGEETLWCPAGDFFGSGVGVNELKSWYRTVSSNGVMMCRWVMPYEKEAHISVMNLGNEPVAVTLRATVDAWKWDSRSMYFHTTWHQQADLVSPPPSDWNYVTLAGRGVYVGDSLALFNPVATWYGEGDEKIWVDGESFPSDIGTGTEDYYNYSWAPQGVFQTPFANQPRAGIPKTMGHNTCSRTRQLDSIPFNQSLKFDIELIAWQVTHLTYAATTHWYAFPGASTTVKPLPEEAVRRIQ
jgi:Protein of unknown function (DUF2961)